jgi:hypothetical protein
MICCTVLWYILYQYVNMPARGCQPARFEISPEPP